MTGETRINFSIPESNHVKLTLFNNMGSEVQTLIDANAPAGSHEVVFDGSNLPDGIYFYQLNAGNYSGVKKLVISR